MTVIRTGRSIIDFDEIGVVGEDIRARNEVKLERVSEVVFVESLGFVRQFMPGDGAQASDSMPLKLSISR